MPTREALEQLYKEMEEVFQPDAPFKKVSKKTTDAELIELIKKEAVDEEGNSTIYTTDMEEDEENPNKVIFSEDAEETIKALGIEIVEPEDAGEEDAPEPEPVKEAAKPAKNGKKEESKAPAKEEPKKGAKAAPAAKEEKKPAAKEAPKKEEKKPAGKAPGKSAPAPANNYTRSIALVDALKDTLANGPATKQEICDLSDELYVEQGGKSGAFVAEVMFRYTVPALIALGIVEKNGNQFKLVE